MRRQTCGHVASKNTEASVGQRQRYAILRSLLVCIGFCLTLVPSAVASTDASAFQDWVKNFKTEALSQGISARTFDAAFARVKAPSKRVKKSQASQPEVTRTSGAYVSGLVSAKRVAYGRKKLDLYRQTLKKIERTYGVGSQTLLAVWGVETFYGRNAGRHNIIQSLATLAATHKRREKYWRAELLAALQILEDGHIALENFKGSWAGAMGHTQFMPTTYRDHAVDFDQDGRRDIWGSEPDALASAAQFLKKRGWVTGLVWGYEVRLPEGFDFGSATPKDKRQQRAWRQLGVRPASGIGWPASDQDVFEVLLPSGADGPAFLVSKNFRVLMRYNPSVRYALAVAHLSDRIAGAPGFIQDWPSNQRSLKRRERKELQRLLTAQGHEIGPVDGIIGRDTKTAIRQFQTARGLPADGHPTVRLLQKLRGTARN